jgi:acetyltransferase-like isoleucine patch superfamily enzyme
VLVSVVTERQIGKRVKLWSSVWVDRFDSLEIGDDVTVGKDVMFVTGGGIKIGHRTMVGHGSKIISVGHRIPPQRGQMRFSGPDMDKIVIANDAWIRDPGRGFVRRNYW